MPRVSSKGIALIKEHEGLRLAPYVAPEGKWTIGYGHLIKKGENFPIGVSITERRAEDILREDLRVAEEAVNKLVTVWLTQDQFDALVSFTFNVGRGSLKRSTLLRKLNEGDYLGAQKQFQRWTKARVNGELIDLPGLVRRRADEAALFKVEEERSPETDEK